MSLQVHEKEQSEGHNRDAGDTHHPTPNVETSRKQDKLAVTRCKHQSESKQKALSVKLSEMSLKASKLPHHSNTDQKQSQAVNGRESSRPQTTGQDTAHLGGQTPRSRYGTTLGISRPQGISGTMTTPIGC